MLDASTLDDRTRPQLDGAAAARNRYFAWQDWRSIDGSRAPSHQAGATQPSHGRR